MKYITELHFFKKQKKVEEKRNPLPNETDKQYWKYMIQWMDYDVKKVNLILKFQYEEDNEFIFNGIWMDDFNISSRSIKEELLKTKQYSAKVGDKSKQFKFSRGKWVFMDNIKEATADEIEFYKFHEQTNKYNL